MQDAMMRRRSQGGHCSVQGHGKIYGQECGVNADIHAVARDRTFEKRLWSRDAEREMYEEQRCE